MSRRFIIIEECEPGIPVTGCGCEGITTSTMLECEDAVLTPGDACPAGRCPECDGLVYLEASEDRRIIELLKANNREVERRRAAEAEARRLETVVRALSSVRVCSCP